MPAIDRTPPRREPATRAPVSAVKEREANSASAVSRMPSASVSSLLSGKPIYRMRDGRLIELPEGMTAAEAAKLEADAVTAQQKLGKGPPPKDVPDVRKPADKDAKKSKAKGKGEGKPEGAGGASKPRTAGARARLNVAGGKVAQYLFGKAGPVLAKGIGALAKLSRNEQTHDDAPKKRHQAEMAVVIPVSDGQSKTNFAQVGEVGARPAPPVDESRGKRRLQESLSENVPKSIEDVDNFKRDKKAQHMGTDVMQVVQGDKNAVVGTFADMEQTKPPAPPEHAPETLPPPEPAPPTPFLGLGQGAVAPLQPEHTDTSKYTNEADAKLKEEGVTQEQLDMVDSGDLASANKEKKGMEQMAKAEPLAIQKFSRDQGDKVDKDLKSEEKTGRARVSSKRKAGLGGTSQKQKHAKSALEKKRDEVAAKINGIHKSTQDRVKKKLADLETQSMKRFDDGNAKATKAFEDTVNRELEAYKDDRYSGLFGWARKSRDWILGMDDLPGVKAIFDRNRAIFVSTIDALMAAIAADNKRVIQECKDDLAKARQEIKDYVDKLGPALKAIGKKTAGEVNRQLDEMDSFVRKQEEDLQQKLADKQQAAIKAIDEKIEKMKDAMSGALAKLGKLLLWAAKKLFTWALSQFGYSLGEIEGIINKGVAVLKAIFTKPIVFVKNLMKAAVQGFKNFGKNFLKHLQDALFEWLTGSLQGIRLPKSWDLEGIFELALQMIGATYANLRVHMVTVMGEKVVVGLEEGFKLVRTLITRGLMAAWEQLQEMAGEMKKAFVEAVKDFIKWKIVEEAIKWVGALLIPGAGLIKAAIGIYDTVVFFIKKAATIAKMIANFLGSIGEIAAGNIGAAADAMERGLARALSLVINFLASLLRLGGITAKIREHIQRIKGKVDAVLLKVAKWVWAKAQKVFGKVKEGAKAAVAKLANWWKREKKFLAGGTPHRVFYAGGPKNAAVRVASDEKSVEQFLADTAASATQGAKKTAWDAADAAQKQVKALRTQRKPPTPDGVDPAIDPQIDAQFDIIAANLPVLFDTSGAWGTDAFPAQLTYPKKAVSLYRTLYLGPRVREGGILRQADLKAKVGKSAPNEAKGFVPTAKIDATTAALDQWCANGGKVETYEPFHQKSWPYNATAGGVSQLGLAPQFQVQVGTAFTYVKGSTPGGRKINEALKQYGYYGSKSSGEDTDGDHVIEAQLIGDTADQIPNMWPLLKHQNRHGKSLESNAEVETPTTPKTTFGGLGEATKAFLAQKPAPPKKALRLMVKKAIPKA